METSGVTAGSSSPSSLSASGSAVDLSTMEGDRDVGDVPELRFRLRSSALKPSNSCGSSSGGSVCLPDAGDFRLPPKCTSTPMAPDPKPDQIRWNRTEPSLPGSNAARFRDQGGDDSDATRGLHRNGDFGLKTDDAQADEMDSGLGLSGAGNVSVNWGVDGKDEQDDQRRKSPTNQDCLQHHNLLNQAGVVTRSRSLLKFKSHSVDDNHPDDSGILDASSLSLPGPSLSHLAGKISLVSASGAVERDQGRRTRAANNVRPSPSTSADRDLHSVKRKRLTFLDLEQEEGSQTEEGGGRQHGQVRVRVPGSFVGRERLDFVRRLNEMGLVHILDQLWSSLGQTDLLNARLVSCLWHQSLQSSKAAAAPKTERDPENSAREIRRWPVARLRRSPRNPLSSLYNSPITPPKRQKGSNPSRRSPSKTPKKSPSTAAAVKGTLPEVVFSSPSKFRLRLFAEEAMRLNPGEKLESCPRCRSPSVVNPKMSSAKCSRISCQFSYCTACMCEHQGGLGKCRLKSRLKRIPGSRSNSAVTSSGPEKRPLLKDPFNPVEGLNDDGAFDCPGSCPEVNPGSPASSDSSVPVTVPKKSAAVGSSGSKRRLRRL